MGTIVKGIKDARIDQMAASAKMNVAIGLLLKKNDDLEAEVARLTTALAGERAQRTSVHAQDVARVAVLEGALREALYGSKAYPWTAILFDRTAAGAPKIIKCCACERVVVYGDEADLRHSKECWVPVAIAALAKHEPTGEPKCPECGGSGEISGGYRLRNGKTVMIPCPHTRAWTKGGG